MKISALALAGLVVGVSGLFTFTPAQARDAGQLGGGGGGEYRSPCPANMAMFAWIGNAGSALDGVRALCTSVQPDKTTTGTIQTDYHGGSGGSRIQRTCPSNSVVTAMRVWMDGNKVVSRFFLTCRNLQSGATSVLDGRSDGRALEPSVLFSCNPDEVGVGIYGRSGALVDNIGLICERLAVVQPALAPKPPPPVTADNSAVCNAYADRMTKRANDLISNKCNTSGLSTGLKTTDRSVYFRSCTGYGKDAATTITFNERPVADLLAKCLAGGPPPEKTTTVKADVDLYAAPPPLNQDQKNKPLPVGLKKGQKVGFVSCRSDNWCQVTGGWVYGDFITK